MNCYCRILLGMVMLVILTGCMTGREDKDIMSPSESQSVLSPDRPFFKADRKTSFEDDGKFIMVEGNQCTIREHGPESATMLITVDMPTYVNRGTVVLNGWDLRYLNKDHEVRSLRADITHSKLVAGGGKPSTLVFEVEGELSDQNWTMLMSSVFTTLALALIQPGSMPALKEIIMV